MNSRKITNVSLAVLLLCLVLSLVVLKQLPPPKTWQKVEFGMTEIEIRTLLGEPDVGLGEKAMGVWHERGYKLWVGLSADPKETAQLVVEKFYWDRSLPVWLLKLTDQSLW